MAKRFSVIDFEGSVYVLPGKVDQYALESFAPVQEERELLETSEMLKVFYTIYWWNDGSTADADLDEDSAEEVADILGDLLDTEGALRVVSTGKIELPGVLDKPFEDYYELTGAERENYLASKREAQEEHDRLVAQFKADGMTDEEIEQQFRFMALNADDEDEE